MQTIIKVKCPVTTLVEFSQRRVGFSLSLKIARDHRTYLTMVSCWARITQWFLNLFVTIPKTLQKPTLLNCFCKNVIDKYAQKLICDPCLNFSTSQTTRMRMAIWFFHYPCAVNHLRELRCPRGQNKMLWIDGEILKRNSSDANCPHNCCFNSKRSVPRTSRVRDVIPKMQSD